MVRSITKAKPLSFTPSTSSPRSITSLKKQKAIERKKSKQTKATTTVDTTTINKEALYQEALKNKPNAKDYATQSSKLTAWIEKYKDILSDEAYAAKTQALLNKEQAKLERKNIIESSNLFRKFVSESKDYSEPEKEQEKLQEFIEEHSEVLGRGKNYARTQAFIEAESKKIATKSTANILTQAGVDVSTADLSQAINLPTSNVQQRGTDTSSNVLRFFKIDNQGKAVLNKTKYPDYNIEYRADGSIKRIYKTAKTYNYKEYNDIAQDVRTYIPEEYLFDANGNLIKQIKRDDYEAKQYYREVENGKKKGKTEIRRVYDDEIIEWNADGTLKSYEDNEELKDSSAYDYVKDNPTSNKTYRIVRSNRIETYKDGILTKKELFDYDKNAELDKETIFDYLKGTKREKDKITSIEQSELDKARTQYYGVDTSEAVDALKKVNIDAADRIVYNPATGGYIDRYLQQSIDYSQVPQEVNIREFAQLGQSIQQPIDTRISKQKTILEQGLEFQKQPSKITSPYYKYQQMISLTKSATTQDKAANIFASTLPVYTPEVKQLIESGYTEQEKLKELQEIEKDIIRGGGFVSTIYPETDTEKIKYLEGKYKQYEQAYSEYEPAAIFMEDWSKKADKSIKQLSGYEKAFEELPQEVLARGFTSKEATSKLSEISGKLSQAKIEALYRTDPFGFKVSKQEQQEFLKKPKDITADVISLSQTPVKGIKELSKSQQVKELDIISRGVLGAKLSFGIIGTTLRPAGSYLESVGSGFQEWATRSKEIKESGLDTKSAKFIGKLETPFEAIGGFAKGAGKSLKYGPSKTGGLALLSAGITAAAPLIGSVGAGLASFGRGGILAAKTGKTLFKVGSFGLAGAYVGGTYLEAQTKQKGRERYEFYGERLGAEAIAFSVGGFAGSKIAKGLKKSVVTYDPKAIEKLELIYSKPKLKTQVKNVLTGKPLYGKLSEQSKTIIQELKTITPSNKISEGLKYYSESELKTYLGLKPKDIIKRMGRETDIRTIEAGISPSITDYTLNLEKADLKDMYFRGEPVKFIEGQYSIKKYHSVDENYLTQTTFNLIELESGKPITVKQLTTKQDIRTYAKVGEEPLKLIQTETKSVKPSIAYTYGTEKETSAVVRLKPKSGQEFEIPLTEFTAEGRPYESDLLFTGKKEYQDIALFKTGYGGKGIIKQVDVYQTTGKLAESTKYQKGLTTRSDVDYLFKNEDPFKLKELRLRKGEVIISRKQYLPKASKEKGIGSYLRLKSSDEFAISKTKPEQRLGYYLGEYGEKIYEAPMKKIPGFSLQVERGQAPRISLSKSKYYEIRKDIILKGGIKKYAIKKKKSVFDIFGKGKMLKSKRGQAKLAGGLLEQPKEIQKDITKFYQPKTKRERLNVNLKEFERVGYLKESRKIKRQVMPRTLPRIIPLTKTGKRQQALPTSKFLQSRKQQARQALANLGISGIASTMNDLMNKTDIRNIPDISTTPSLKITPKIKVSNIQTIKPKTRTTQIQRISVPKISSPLDFTLPKITRPTPPSTTDEILKEDITEKLPLLRLTKRKKKYKKSQREFGYSEKQFRVLDILGR